jgi:hypothetical protein
VDQPFADCRHDLDVFAQIGAVRPDEDLGVVHRPGGVRKLLAHPHDHVGVGLSRRRAQSVEIGTGDLEGVLEQLDGQLVGDDARGRVVMVPDGVGRDEAFREGDHPGSTGRRFLDEPAGFFHRTFSVEKHGGGLDSCHPDFGIRIAAHLSLPSGRDSCHGSTRIGVGNLELARPAGAWAACSAARFRRAGTGYIGFRRYSP